MDNVCRTTSQRLWSDVTIAGLTNKGCLTNVICHKLCKRQTTSKTQEKNKSKVKISTLLEITVGDQGIFSRRPSAETENM